MSATTTLKFTLDSGTPVPTPTPTPTPSTDTTTTVIGSPNTGENNASSNNVGSTIFTSLFVVIGITALIVFLAKYLKKNRHITFSDKGSFRISMRPRIFVTAGLVLAVAFLGSSIISSNFKNNEGTADAAGSELGVAVTSEMTFDVDREEAAYLTDNVTVTTNGNGYTLEVSTDNSKFCLENSTTDCLNSTSGDITSSDTNKLSSLEVDQWGMSLLGYDPDGKIWGAVPTTPKVIQNKETTSGNTDTTRVYYGVNVGENHADGTYVGRVIYTAYAQDITNQYRVTTINGYVNATGTNTSSFFQDGTTVFIRENCPADHPFLTWVSSDIDTDIISGPSSSGLYQFTMPAKNVTVTALCQGDEESYLVIEYDANAPSGTTATGTTPDTIVNEGETTVNLSENGFSITGYKFVGWACNKSATTKDYTSGQTNVKLSSLTSKCTVDEEADIPTITLYAIWIPVIEYLQEIEPIHCDNMNVLEDISLKDKRDNKQYTVRKYADGRCWMLEDLAFTPTGTLTLDPALTDVTSSGSLTIATSGTSGARYHTQSGYSTLYNYKAATAGTWNNQAANTILPDSLCPAHFKMPDAWNDSTSKFGDMSGEFWNLNYYNIGVANGGGADASNTWKKAFTWAANNDSTYHGPHFTYNGAWDFSTNTWAASEGQPSSAGASGNYASYYLNTTTTNSSGTAVPAAFNPHKAGVSGTSDDWDINSTDPLHGSAIRCLLRTATQMTNRSAYGVAVPDATKS